MRAFLSTTALFVSAVLLTGCTQDTTPDTTTATPTSTASPSPSGPSGTPVSPYTGTVQVKPTDKTVPTELIPTDAPSPSMPTQTPVPLEENAVYQQTLKLGDTIKQQYPSSAPNKLTVLDDGTVQTSGGAKIGLLAFGVELGKYVKLKNISPSVSAQHFLLCITKEGEDPIVYNSSSTPSASVFVDGSCDDLPG